MARTGVPIAWNALETAAAVIKCLGHPLRLRLVEGLESGERTVTDLQTFSGATQTMVSQHLATLRGHGIVEAHRNGTHVHYRLIEPKVHRILACIRESAAD
jgi:ArsR family transcriptional regulator